MLRYPRPRESSRVEQAGRQAVLQGEPWLHTDCAVRVKQSAVTGMELSHVSVAQATYKSYCDPKSIAVVCT